MFCSMNLPPKNSISIIHPYVIHLIEAHKNKLQSYDLNTDLYHGEVQQVRPAEEENYRFRNVIKVLQFQNSFRQDIEKITNKGMNSSNNLHGVGIGGEEGEALFFTGKRESEVSDPPDVSCVVGCIIVFHGFLHQLLCLSHRLFP